MSTYMSTTGMSIFLAAKEPSTILNRPIAKVLGNYKYEYELIQRYKSKDSKYQIYEVLRVPNVRKQEEKQHINIIKELIRFLSRV